MRNENSAIALNGDESARDSRGRFKPGHPGGPGRPPRMTELSYLRGLSDAVPADLWQKIAIKAAELAAAGDPQARDWLSRWLLPQPIQGATPLRQVRIADGRAELSGCSALAVEVAGRHAPNDSDADARRTLAQQLTAEGIAE